MTAPAPHKSILLIGASRGLGLAVAKEYLNNGAIVVATVRGTEHTALHDLQGSFADRLEIESVDITIEEQVANLHDRMLGRQFDLLFVNAGVVNDEQETVATTSAAEFTRLMVTNALSPMRVIETFKDLVDPAGTIAIMSSGQGSVANNENGGFEIYRASKAALNQLMRSYAARNHDDPRTLLLVAPGWVKNTGVGGPNGRLTIDESIPNLVRTIDAQHGRGGLAFLDYLGNKIAW
jgi:NAD(P)-dependent dehydrogenase (short-subunit alcohol dehydrogenase family)